jgi:hypothetical protein
VRATAPEFSCAEWGTKSLISRLPFTDSLSPSSFFDTKINNYE